MPMLIRQRVAKTVTWLGILIYLCFLLSSIILIIYPQRLSDNFAIYANPMTRREASNSRQSYQNYSQHSTHSKSPIRYDEVNGDAWK